MVTTLRHVAEFVSVRWKVAVSSAIAVNLELRLLKKCSLRLTGKILPLEDSGSPVQTEASYAQGDRCEYPSRNQRPGVSQMHCEMAYPELTRGAFTLSDKIRGGGHVGPSPSFGYHTSWPLASLSVAPDSLTFSMWPVKYRFEKSLIQCLLKKRLRLWRQLTARPSLVIVHTNQAFSKFVVFQPAQFSQLETLLAQNGYQLTNEEAGLPVSEPIRFSNVFPVIGYIAAMVGLIAGFVAGFIAIGVSTGFIGGK